MQSSYQSEKNRLTYTFRLIFGSQCPLCPIRLDPVKGHPTLVAFSSDQMSRTIFSKNASAIVHGLGQESASLISLLIGQVRSGGLTGWRHLHRIDASRWLG